MNDPAVVTIIIAGVSLTVWLVPKADNLGETRLASRLMRVTNRMTGGR